MKITDNTCNDFGESLEHSVSEEFRNSKDKTYGIVGFNIPLNIICHFGDDFMGQMTQQCHSTEGRCQLTT